MYDSLFDYEFDRAMDEMCDPDERDIVNRPEDDEDSWTASCVTEEEWKRRNTIFMEEWQKAQAEIKERYKL